MTLHIEVSGAYSSQLARVCSIRARKTKYAPTEFSHYSLRTGKLQVHTTFPNISNVLSSYITPASNVGHNIINHDDRTNPHPRDLRKPRQMVLPVLFRRISRRRAAFHLLPISFNRVTLIPPLDQMLPKRAQQEWRHLVKRETILILRIPLSIGHHLRFPRLCRRITHHALPSSFHSATKRPKMPREVNCS